MFSLIQIIFFTIGCLATLSLFALVFSQRFRQRQTLTSSLIPSPRVKNQNTDQSFFSRAVITNFERKMFLRLKLAFPEHHVLAQVAFSALITHDSLKIRNLFNRKVTDFVILDQKFNVIAIIELDDPSHLGREADDAKRDKMLEEAGYRVFRYTNIPSTHVLRKEIL